MARIEIIGDSDGDLWAECECGEQSDLWPGYDDSTDLRRDMADRLRRSHSCPDA